MSLRLRCWTKTKKQVHIKVTSGFITTRCINVCSLITIKDVVKMVQNSYCLIIKVFCNVMAILCTTTFVISLEFDYPDVFSMLEENFLMLRIVILSEPNKP